MRKRTEKHRGGRTHGRGKKAGRGAGLRGGKGNAGLNKHNQLKVKIENPDYFGRRGFKRHPSLVERGNAINVGTVQNRLPGYIQSGLARKEGKGMVLDLGQMGYDKLLGGGTVKSPLTLIVAEATERARSKVEAAGGKIEVPSGNAGDVPDTPGEDAGDIEEQSESE